MNAALIGLLGVVVGALLTGFASLWVEEKKLQKSAAVAAYLIADELATVQQRIESSLDANPAERWLGDLPTQAWQERLMEFGFQASSDSLQELADAYRIIDRLNADKGDGNLSEKLKNELRTSDVPALKLVKEHVDAAARSLSVKPTLRKTRRWSFRVIAGLIFVVALVAVIFPHPNVNSTTMATVVESWFGNDSLASCNPQGVGWSCNVDELSGSRHACGLETFSASASRPVARLVTTAVTSNDSGGSDVSGETCTETVADPIDLSTDASVIVGFPQTPSEIERSRAANRIFEANTPRQRPIAVFWDWVRNLL